MQNSAESPKKPLGVIDALRDGFTFCNRHPWLILIPIFVDFLLWFAPKISLQPLIDRTLDTLFNQPNLPAEFSENAALGIEALQTFGAQFNLLSLVSGFLAGVPSYLARPDTATLPQNAVIPVGDAGQALLYAIAFVIAGLFFGSIWYALIVLSLDAELRGFAGTIRRAGWIWLNSSLYLLGLLVLAIALGSLIALLLTMLLLLTGPGGMALLNIFSLLLIWLAIWVAIGLNFTISAIALDGVNVARAAWRSLNVVGRNLSSTLGFILLGFLLIEGFATIWLRLSSSGWGIPIGILGTAYIGTSLAAATLLFYRDRYQHWQRIRSEMTIARRQG